MTNKFMPLSSKVWDWVCD